MGSLVQNIGSAANRTNSTSIAISVSLTVTAGNDIFVSLNSDDAGSAHGVTDNLGNTYTLEADTTNAGVSRSYLFRGKITTGGTLTTITCSWTSNVAAKVLIAQEFASIGDKKTDGDGFSSQNVINPLGQTGSAVGEMWIYTGNQETDEGLLTGNHNNGTIISHTGVVQATSGGGAASNISAGQGCAFGFSSIAGLSIYMFNAASETNREGIGCGAIYYPKNSLTQAAFRFYLDDSTESGSTAIAAQDTDITRDIGSGNKNVVLRVRVQNSSADVVAFSEKYELRASVNGGAYNEVPSSGDSFLPTSTVRLVAQSLGQTTADLRNGQSFTGQGGTLSKAFINVYKVGTPSDDVYVEIYAHTGTFGTTGTPTGSPLATSDVIVGSSFGTTLGAPTAFNFSGGNQITLTDGTNYFIVARRSGAADASNFYRVTTTNFTGATQAAKFRANWNDDGNYVTWNGSAWAATTSGYDLFFGIQESNPARDIYGYVSTNLTIGGATTNLLGSGSGTFEAGVISDGQVANETDLAVSNYTELLFPITLDATFLDVGDTVDFRLYKRGSALTSYTVTPRVTLQGNTTTTKTQTGKATITAQTTRTQTGISRLRLTTTKTQTGVAKLSIQTTRTQTGKSAIRLSVARNQTGVARIRQTVTSTQLGKARVTVSVQRTQSGVSRIETAYSRENNASLPTGVTMLGTGYSSTDVTDVATSNDVRVTITGGSGYLLHQFKVTNTNNTTPISVTWEGQSTVASSSNNVFLQVYNWNTTSWETIDTNAAASANTDFTLGASITVSVGNYYGLGNVVVFRVYQGI